MTENKTPYTAVLNETRMALMAGGDYPNMVNFGLGNPGHEVPQDVIEALRWEIDQKEGFSDYGPGKGYEITQQAMGKFLDKVRGTPYSKPADQVAITLGITATMEHYLQVLAHEKFKREKSITPENGLRVLVPVPAYAWYFNCIKGIPGAKAEPLDTASDNFTLTKENLKAYLEQHDGVDALILNFPCNPTGQNPSQEEWEGIAQVLEEYAGKNPHFQILLDNAYYDMQFGEQATGLLKAASPDLRQRIMEFNSVAKYSGFAGHSGPGFAASENAKNIALLRNKLAPNLGVGYEEALRRAFHPDKFAAEAKEKIVGPKRRRCQFVANYLNKVLKPVSQNSEIAVSPQGGMFVFADFSQWLNKKVPGDAQQMRDTLIRAKPEYSVYFENAFDGDRINDDKDLALYLMLKADVVTIPGQDFGIQGDQGMIRFALGDIGKLTSYKNNADAEIAKILPEAGKLESKPLDELRKLNSVMNRMKLALGNLQELQQRLTH